MWLDWRLLSNGNTLNVTVDAQTINPTSGSYRIDTTTFDDGLHDISVNLTTVNGDNHALVAELVDYTFDNNPPVVTQISNALTFSSLYDFELDVTDAGSEVTQVKISGLDIVGTGDRYTRTLPLSTGFNTFNVYVKDRLDHTDSFPLTTARIESGPGLYNEDIDLFGDNIPANSWVVVTVDGVDLPTFISGDRAEIDLNPDGSEDGVKPVSIAYVNETGQTFNLNLGNYTFDHKGPEVTLTSPLAVDSSTYNMTLDIHDDFSDIVSVEIEETGQFFDVDGLSLDESVGLSVSLNNDFNQFTIIATDATGNKTTELFEIVRFDNLNGITFINGEVTLFENTPDSVFTNMSVVVKDTGSTAVPFTPGNELTVDTETASGFTDGDKTVEISVIGNTGNSTTNSASPSKVSKSIYIDNTAPVFSWDENDKVISQDYTLDFDVDDGTGSGIASVRVDGMDATFAGNAGTVYSYEFYKTLPTAVTPFSVVLTDTMGNSRTVNVAVSADLHDPSAEITFDEARIWNTTSASVEYRTNVSGTPLLYNPGNSWRSPSIGGQTIDSVNDFNWIKIKLTDTSNAASVGSAPADLTATYKYLINDSQVYSWRDTHLTPAGNPGEYYLAIGPDTLDESSNAVGKDAKHTIRVKVVDTYNRSYEAFKDFKMVFTANTSAVTTSSYTEINEISDMEFDDLATQVQGSTRLFGGAIFENNYKEPVYIQANTHGSDPTALVERYGFIRKNKTLKEGRRVSPQSRPSCNWTNIGNGTYWLVTNQNDWDKTDWYWDHTVKKRTGGVNTTWKLQHESGGSYPEVRKDADAFASYTFPSFWGSDGSGIEWITSDSASNTFTGMQTGVSSALWAVGTQYDGGFKAKFGDDQRHKNWYPTNLYSSAPSTTSHTNKMGLITHTTACSGLTYLRWKIEYRWTSYSGYPKTIAEGGLNETVPWSVTNAGVEYLNEAGAVLPVTNGYVEVQPNEKVVLRQKVSFPSRTWDQSTVMSYSGEDRDRKTVVSISDGYKVKVVAKNQITDTSVLDDYPFEYEILSGNNPSFETTYNH